ncbi:MAG: flagellar hook-length control protein FliK [Vannielia sp.]|uniref:flagellar hook-length control protein FliK n=1 Tax=Vannielia sp. TaxID=2813045 RepID=UPI003B8C1912
MQNAMSSDMGVFSVGPAAANAAGNHARNGGKDGQESTGDWAEVYAAQQSRAAPADRSSTNSGGAEATPDAAVVVGSDDIADAVGDLADVEGTTEDILLEQPDVEDWAEGVGDGLEVDEAGQPGRVEDASGMAISAQGPEVDQVKPRADGADGEASLRVLTGDAVDMARAGAGDDIEARPESLPETAEASGTGRGFASDEMRSAAVTEGEARQAGSEAIRRAAAGQSAEARDAGSRNPILSTALAAGDADTDHATAEVSAGRAVGVTARTTPLGAPSVDRGGAELSAALAEQESGERVGGAVEGEEVAAVAEETTEREAPQQTRQTAGAPEVMRAAAATNVAAMVSGADLQATQFAAEVSDGPGIAELRPTASVAGMGAATVLPPGATVPQRVATQVAEVFRPLPDGPVELRLHPEELGRLKLSFTSGEAGLHVVVAAERPETLDMMRRNIDLLAQEMRRLGHEGAQFSFAGGDPAFSQNDTGAQGQGHKIGWAGDTGEPGSTPGRPGITQHPGLRLGADGLDLRL